MSRGSFLLPALPPASLLLALTLSQHDMVGGGPIPQPLHHALFVTGALHREHGETQLQTQANTLLKRVGILLRAAKLQMKSQAELPVGAPERQVHDGVEDAFLDAEVCQDLHGDLVQQEGGFGLRLAVVVGAGIPRGESILPKSASIIPNSEIANCTQGRMSQIPLLLSH